MLNITFQNKMLSWDDLENVAISLRFYGKYKMITIDPFFLY